MTGRIRRLLIGGYGPPRGRAEGIAIVEHDRDAGALRMVVTVAVPSATYVLPI